MSSTPALASAASPYQRTLERGFPGLRFEPVLEREFQRFHSRVNLGRVRWSAWLAFALYGVFVAIDILTLPPDVHRWTAPIRVLLIMPGFLGVILATRHEAWQPRMQGPITAAAAIAGLGTVALIAIGLRHRHPLPYEGILLVAMFIYLLASLGWWRALAVNLATLAALIGTELAWQSDPQARLYQIVFMLAANVVGATGAYFLEHSTRSVFLVQRLLNERALHDGLTGLANRAALGEHLDRAWRQALRERATVAIAMVDVDHFKRFNDRYGHAEGDAALQAVAAVVGAQARRPLDLAARYGGEEFMLVWYRPVDAELDALGQQLRAAIEQLGIAHLDSECGVLTASIGIASTVATASGTPHRLMEAADAALYAAKQAGRNGVRVSGGVAAVA
ncbi:diguanylate cyclase [Lysobacter sp. TY2-98]|uniref:diguanylate cyclase n=1 Tax=Lysobacter sp. TY2-98 TaxID=2290922 RepID=UPI0013B3F714|nr:diguanylate cyclase [Lysobacter sp. TY2-98]